jgi:hypothetical protein
MLKWGNSIPDEIIRAWAFVVFQLIPPNLLIICDPAVDSSHYGVGCVG